MKKICLFILSTALILALCACGGGKPKPTAASSAAPTAMPAASAQATVPPGPAASLPALPTGVKTEPLTAWPAADLPARLPEFTYGTFQKDGSGKAVDAAGSATYILRFTGVAKDDVNGYGATIAGNGFAVVPTEADGAYTLACTLDNQDGTVTSVTVARAQDGTCVVQIALNANPAG